MNFTDSPFEWMMKQKPHVSHRDRDRPEPPARPRKASGRKPAPASVKGASGHVDPKLPGGRGNG